MKQIIPDYSQFQVNPFEDILGASEMAIKSASEVVSPFVSGALSAPALLFDPTAQPELYQSMQERMTYQPKSQRGQEFQNIQQKITQPIGELFEEGTDWLGTQVAQLVPESAPEELKATAFAVGKTLPEAAGFALARKPISKGLDTGLNKANQAMIDRGLALNAQEASYSMGQRGVISRALTDDERARLELAGIPSQDFTFKGRKYTEIPDVGMRVNNDAMEPISQTIKQGRAKDVLDHDLFIARPELENYKIRLDSEMAPGEGVHDRHGKVITVGGTEFDNNSIESLKGMTHELSHGASTASGYPMGGRGSKGQTYIDTAKKEAQEQAPYASSGAELQALRDTMDYWDELSPYEGYRHLTPEILSRTAEARAVYQKKLEETNPPEVVREIMRKTPIEDFFPIDETRAIDWVGQPKDLEY